MWGDSLWTIILLFYHFTFVPKCDIFIIDGDDNMFNQQEYINDYIKNTYKTVKLRIRNDDKIIINKIRF